MRKLSLDKVPEAYTVALAEALYEVCVSGRWRSRNREYLEAATALEMPSDLSRSLLEKWTSIKSGRTRSECQMRAFKVLGAWLEVIRTAAPDSFQKIELAYPGITSPLLGELQRLARAEFTANIRVSSKLELDKTLTKSASDDKYGGPRWKRRATNIGRLGMALLLLMVVAVVKAMWDFMSNGHSAQSKPRIVDEQRPTSSRTAGDIKSNGRAPSPPTHSVNISSTLQSDGRTFQDCAEDMVILVNRSELPEDSSHAEAVYVDLGAGMNALDLAGRPKLNTATILAKEDESKSTSAQRAFVAKMSDYRGRPTPYPGLWPLARLYVVVEVNGVVTLRKTLDTALNLLSRAPRMRAYCRMTRTSHCNVNDDGTMSISGLQGRAEMAVQLAGSRQVASSTIAQFITDAQPSGKIRFSVGDRKADLFEEELAGYSRTASVSSLGLTRSLPAYQVKANEVEQMRLDLDGKSAGLSCGGVTSSPVMVGEVSGTGVIVDLMGARIKMVNLFQTLKQ
jgi:hypothetical protein